MEARPAAFALLLLTGCYADVDDNAVPAQADIQRLEEMLSRHPCVGELNQWERNYRYSRKAGILWPYPLNPDLDVVEFHLRRVGTISITPGRKVLRPRPGGDWPDSNAIQSVDGRFTLSNRSLSLSPCEPIAGR